MPLIFQTPHGEIQFDWNHLQFPNQLSYTEKTQSGTAQRREATDGQFWNLVKANNNEWYQLGWTHSAIPNVVDANTFIRRKFNGNRWEFEVSDATQPVLVWQPVSANTFREQQINIIFNNAHNVYPDILADEKEWDEARLWVAEKDKEPNDYHDDVLTDRQSADFFHALFDYDLLDYKKSVGSEIIYLDGLKQLLTIGQQQVLDNEEKVDALLDANGNPLPKPLKDLARAFIPQKLREHDLLNTSERRANKAPLSLGMLKTALLKRIEFEIKQFEPTYNANIPPFASNDANDPLHLLPGMALADPRLAIAERVSYVRKMFEYYQLALEGDFAFIGNSLNQLNNIKTDLNKFQQHPDRDIIRKLCKDNPDINSFHNRILHCIEVAQIELMNAHDVESTLAAQPNGTVTTSPQTNITTTNIASGNTTLIQPSIIVNPSIASTIGQQIPIDSEQLFLILKACLQFEPGGQTIKLYPGAPAEYDIAYSFNGIAVLLHPFNAFHHGPAQFKPFFDKIKQENNRFIGLPQINGGHWNVLEGTIAGAANNRQITSINGFESLNEDRTSNNNIIARETWLREITGNLPDNIPVHANFIGKQSDGWSCGYFCLAFMLKQLHAANILAPNSQFNTQYQAIIAALNAAENNNDANQRTNFANRLAETIKALAIACAQNVQVQQANSASNNNLPTPSQQPNSTPNNNNLPTPQQPNSTLNNNLPAPQQPASTSNNNSPTPSQQSDENTTTTTTAENSEFDAQPNRDQIKKYEALAEKYGTTLSQTKNQIKVVVPSEKGKSVITIKPGVVETKVPDKAYAEFVKAKFGDEKPIQIESKDIETLKLTLELLEKEGVKIATAYIVNKQGKKNIPLDNVRKGELSAANTTSQIPNNIMENLSNTPALRG